MSDAVVIALIVAVSSSPVATTWVTRRTRKDARDAKQAATEATATAAETRTAIGTPNGKGDVVTMLETLLSREASQDIRLVNVETMAGRHSSQLAALEVLQLNHEGRIKALEDR